MITGKKPRRMRLRDAKQQQSHRAIDTTCWNAAFPERTRTFAPRQLAETTRIDPAVKATTVQPRTPGSLRLRERPGPAAAAGMLMVQGIGIYGTDHKALEAADLPWLAGLITGRIPLARWDEAFEDRDDIKVVLEFEAAAA